MDSEKKQSGQPVVYTGYIVALITVAVVGTLTTGSALVYLQYYRTVQVQNDHLHQYQASDRYFRGKLTFSGQGQGHGDNVDMTQEVFMDDEKHEQLLHIPGNQMDVYILQKFHEGTQMAVVFLANTTGVTGNIVMCNDAPLEGEYVPASTHIKAEQENGLNKNMKVSEPFKPTTEVVEFPYRTCEDIPSSMYSQEVSSDSTSYAPEKASRKKRSMVFHGNWCGDNNDALGQPCCADCNADFRSCTSPTCSPLEDDVDGACFEYKMCEACTSRQSTELPSCFCVKDFSRDLERYRCRSALPPPPAMMGPGMAVAAMAGSGPAMAGVGGPTMAGVGGPGMGIAPSVAGMGLGPSAGPTGSVLPVVVSSGAAADVASAVMDTVADVSVSGGGLPVKSAIDAAAANMDPAVLAAVEAQAQAELQATIADIKMENMLSARAPSVVRRKRFVGLAPYDRLSCLKYRSRTLTELMHQRCWCPVYIRVQYVCGYQQVAGSCKVTDHGEKCAVKYQVCSRIMSKNTLNAVNFKKCPSIP